MSNLNINKTFCLVFVIIVLILFALTFVFWLGYKVGTTKSEIVWSHGDFSNETAVEYANSKTEIMIDTNNKLIDLIKSVTVETPEMILFRHVTSGEWAKEFKPTIFLDIVNTDLSECFIDDRLRLNLNGKIYWIRLEKD